MKPRVKKVVYMSTTKNNTQTLSNATEEEMADLRANSDGENESGDFIEFWADSQKDTRLWTVRARPRVLPKDEKQVLERARLGLQGNSILTRDRVK